MKHYSTISGMMEDNGYPPPEHPLILIRRCGDNFLPDELEITTDFYVVAFKKIRSGKILYGRTSYDHTSGSMLFISPRQVIQFKDTEFEEDGFVIILHEDMLTGHFLYNEMQQYHFFDYEANEALHVSPQEKDIIWDLYGKIETEYYNNLDEFTSDIMLTHVHSILKYSQRFYRRQFINRTTLSGKTVSRFTEALVNYLPKGLPTVNQLAAEMNLSPRYLSDLLKQETGKTAIELIHIHLISEAKNRLRSGVQNISEIAFSLGFENLPYFSRLFKKEVGMSPNEFRRLLDS